MKCFKMWMPLVAGLVAGMIPALAQDKLYLDNGSLEEAQVSRIDGKEVFFKVDGKSRKIAADRITRIDFADGGVFAFRDGQPSILTPGHFSFRGRTILAEGIAPVSEAEFWRWVDKNSHYDALRSGFAATAYGAIGGRIGGGSLLAGALLMGLVPSKREDTYTFEPASAMPPSLGESMSEESIQSVTIASYREFPLAGPFLTFCGLGVFLDSIGWDYYGASLLDRLAGRTGETLSGADLEALNRQVAATARREKWIGAAGIAGGSALLGTGLALFEKNCRKTYYTTRAHPIVNWDSETQTWKYVTGGTLVQEQKPNNHYVAYPFFFLGAAMLHAGVGVLNQGLTRSRALPAELSFGAAPHGYGLTFTF